MASSEPAVLTRGLTKIFHGRPAVDGLDLEVPRGGVFALLGPNGAGKTTTIKLLLNLLPPTAGEIRVLGLDAVADSVAVRRRVGYQAETQRFYFHAGVGELIDFCCSLYPRWNQERVDRYCRLFELPARARVAELSKGRQTLLALVLAIGPDPEMLLLDEPVTGLDPLRRRQVLKLLVEEMSGEGRTIIFSSHQLQDVERIADRVSFLLRGRLILSRPLEQLLAEEKKVRVLFPGPPPADLANWPGVRRVVRVFYRNKYRSIRFRSLMIVFIAASIGIGLLNERGFSGWLIRHHPGLSLLLSLVLACLFYFLGRRRLEKMDIII